MTTMMVQENMDNNPFFGHEGRKAKRRPLPYRIRTQIEAISMSYIYLFRIRTRR